jgi:hypothetical protein
VSDEEPVKPVEQKPWFIECAKDRRNIYRMLRFLGFSSKTATIVRQWRKGNIIKYIAHHCDDIKKELEVNKKNER